jgi:hypothetical protein
LLEAEHRLRARVVVVAGHLFADTLANDGALGAGVTETGVVTTSVAAAVAAGATEAAAPLPIRASFSAGPFVAAPRSNGNGAPDLASENGVHRLSSRALVARHKHRRSH